MERKSFNFNSTYSKSELKEVRNNILYPLIHKCTCAYQGVRNVNLEDKFAYVINHFYHLKKRNDSKVFVKAEAYLEPSRASVI